MYREVHHTGYMPLFHQILNAYFHVGLAYLRKGRIQVL